MKIMQINIERGKYIFKIPYRSKEKSAYNLPRELHLQNTFKIMYQLLLLYDRHVISHEKVTMD